MLGNKYLVAGIGIILVLVAAYNIKFFSSKSKAPEITTVEKSEAVKSSEPIKHIEPGINKNPERILEKEDKNKWKRDPFGLQAIKKPASKEPEIGEDFHLMGIIKRDGRSRVLINGKVYSVDDKIGDVVIKDIKKHGIVLFSDGKNQEISFEDYKVLKEKTK
jgi:hypothetical protein